MTNRQHDYVLIVDDDPDIGETLDLVLQTRGYRCSVARDGAEALECLKSDPLPDVILLDMMMPGMNGQEFRSEQLKDARLANVPVVLVTADDKANQKASDLGIARVLRKPFDVDALVAAVRDSIGQVPPTSQRPLRVQ